MSSLKTLMPHQREDAHRLLEHPVSGCFSGMGTGKTLTAAAAASYWIAGAGTTARVLVVAPPIALTMWAGELDAEFGLHACLLRTGKSPILPGVDAVVVSYDIATKRAEELRDWVAGGVVILDESHALKAVKAKRTKAILGSGGLVSRAERTLCLTGTPMTRYADDLYPFLARADLAGMRERCGGVRLEDFQRRYTVRMKKQFHPRQRPVWMSVASRNIDELNEWMYGGPKPLCVRRTLREVAASMPDITRQALTVSAPLSGEVKALLKEYQTVDAVTSALASKDETLASIMRKLGESKVADTADYLTDLVDAGATDGGILVGVWHRDAAEALAQVLNNRNIRVALINGNTPHTKRDRIAQQFNDGTLSVLVGQIASMGVSLNLQAGGHTIVTMEETWSPAIMDQFYARLHRIGQSYPVQVINLRSDHKIERILVQILARKAREQDKLNITEDCA